jgi:hypothetical protein
MHDAGGAEAFFMPRAASGDARIAPIRELTRLFVLGFATFIVSRIPAITSA